MKNLIIISFYLFSGLLTLISCSKDEATLNQPSLSVELLVNDSDFIQILDIQSKMSSRFRSKFETISQGDQSQYINNIIVLIESGSNDRETLSKVSSMMGFDSEEEYFLLNRELVKSAKSLKTSFPQIAEDFETYEIFLAATEIVNLKYGVSSARISVNCGAILSVCNNKADATLALATTGCVASVFIPVVGPFIGVGCEAAALYNHYTDVQLCYLSYEICADGE